MAVLVKVQLDLHPEHVEAFHEYIGSIVHETRGFDGCQSMVSYSNQDEPTDVVFVETWDSRGHYERYFAWREETGALDKLGPMLASAPHVAYYDDTGV